MLSEILADAIDGINICLADAHLCSTYQQKGLMPDIEKTLADMNSLWDKINYRKEPCPEQQAANTASSKTTCQ